MKHACRRGTGRITGVLASLLALAAAGPARGRLAEAPELYFGSVSNGGTALPAGTLISARIAGQATELDSYELGSEASLVSGGKLLYRLAVPIDALDPREPDTARPGDVLEFLVDGAIAGQATVEARGLAHRLDLDLVNAPGIILWSGQSGCFDWELLGAAGLASSNEVQLSWRLKNRCASALARAELRLRPGGVFTAPAVSGDFVAGSGRHYKVSALSGPNGGLVFEPLAAGLASGEAEQFAVRMSLVGLGATSELWNTAQTVDGSKGGVVVPWQTALSPGLDGVPLQEASACAEPSAQSGFSDVTLRWTVHPWSSSRDFHVYRLEPGNPTAVRLTAQPLAAGTQTSLTLHDELPFLVRALPSYRIEPLRGNPLQAVAAEVVPVELVIGCTASTPTPTVAASTPTPTPTVAASTPTPTLPAGTATPTLPAGTPTPTPLQVAALPPGQTPWAGLLVLGLALALATGRRRPAC